MYIDHEIMMEALQEISHDDAAKLEDLMNSHEWEAFGRLVRDVIDNYKEGVEDEQNNSTELTQEQEFAEWGRDADLAGIH